MDIIEPKILQKMIIPYTPIVIYDNPLNLY